MNLFLHFVKSYPFTTVLVAAVWYLSFFTPPKTRLDEVEFIDKWVHIAMYGGTCAVMWIEYVRNHKEKVQKKKLFWLAWIAPIAMSGAIELLQEYCTGGRRSGDWLDLAANATGVTLAAVFGMVLMARRRAKASKGVQ